MESTAVERPPEQEIYERLWEGDEYRKFSPGEQIAREFLLMAQPRFGSSVIDFGCGSGRAGFQMAMPPPIGAALKVTFVDFAKNCLDEDIRAMLETQSHALKFVQADLTVPRVLEKMGVVAEYGFCSDVMEHIPEEKVESVINNCLMSARHCFFQICLTKDHFGEKVGHPLHITVKPYQWWLEQFQKRDCTLHFAKGNEQYAFFYVTAWQSAQAVSEIGTVNTEEETIKENVKTNIARGFQQVQPHETNQIEVVIIGGGPTLNDHEQTIRDLRARDNVRIVTLNGGYNWAVERGLPIGATIVCDAREFNKRFVQPVVDVTKYLMCSQVHPSVLDGLPHDRTLLWHTSAEQLHDILKAQYEVCYPIPGGSTVLLRAIPLLRMLGFKRFHLFGCDSCLSEGERHHAYEQPENDKASIVPVSLNGRMFHCHAWMVSQAHEFIGMVQMLGEEIELEIYGDGLLKAILEEGARLDDLRQFSLD